MKCDQEEVQRIAKLCLQAFRTFGGGQSSAWGNPISEALKHHPPVFAAGVDVAAVVEFVLANVQVPKSKPAKRKAKR